MLTAENEEYNLAKEERLRKENELVHWVIHPLLDKTEEQLREHDSKIPKEAEEQKGRQENWQGSGHPRKQEEAMIVVRWPLSMDQQKKGGSSFSREKTPEKVYMEGGVRKELIRWKDW
jgi:hypothetical protein